MVCLSPGKSNLQAIGGLSLGITGNTNLYNTLTVSGSAVLANGLTVTGQSNLQAIGGLSPRNNW